MSGASGNQILTGDGGDNMLVGGGGNDYLGGDAGNDTLIAGGGSDTVEGGAGDDFLNAGGAGGGGRNADGVGYDTYVFNFSLVTTPGQTFVFRDGDTPNANADTSAWTQYAKQLDAWRSSLEAQYSTTDQNSVDTINVDTYHRGVLTHFDLDNTFTVGGSTVLKAEGNDTVAQLHKDDVLEFKGIASMDDVLAHITTSVADYNNDGDLDTMLSFDGGNGGVLILGAEYVTIQALVDSGHIHIG